MRGRCRRARRAARRRSRHREEVGAARVRFNIPGYCALLLAKRLGRPVKWVGTRPSIHRDEQGARHRAPGEMALDASGRILACDSSTCATGPIRIHRQLREHGQPGNVASASTTFQAVHVRRSSRDQHGPTAAYRRAGRPVSSTRSSAWSTRRHELGWTGRVPPRNLVAKGQISVRIATGFESTAATSRACRQGVKAAEWNSSKREDGIPPPRAGCAGKHRTYIEASARAASRYDSTDRGTRRVHHPARDSHSHARARTTYGRSFPACSACRWIARCAPPTGHAAGRNPTGGSARFWAR